MGLTLHRQPGPGLVAVEPEVILVMVAMVEALAAAENLEQVVQAAAAEVAAATEILVGFMKVALVAVGSAF